MKVLSISLLFLVVGVAYGSDNAAASSSAQPISSPELSAGREDCSIGDIQECTVEQLARAMIESRIEAAKYRAIHANRTPIEKKLNKTN